MGDKEYKVFYARNLQEFFYHLKTIQGIQVIGGCTRLKKIPEKSISSSSIPELSSFKKHERYIEFGPGFTLNQVLDIGETHIPSILYQAIKSVANPFIRNIATIGGNILEKHHKLTLYAPLLALDAQLELKTQSETSYMSLQNFTDIPKGHILSNIRIPINDWDVAIFTRLGPESRITPYSASFAFLAYTEKSVISNIRIAFGGSVSFRCLQLENRLLGLRLPINENNIMIYVKEAETTFDIASKNKTYMPILKQQFLNLVRYSLEQLT